MCDLFVVLPDFDTSSYSHLLFSLEKNNVTVTDLLTIDAADIIKKCPLPILEVRRLVADMIATCQRRNGVAFLSPSTSSDLARDPTVGDTTNGSTGRAVPMPQPDIITTLDDEIDRTLGGGVHTRHITEVCGESAVGKTQFVLGLLLSVQLPKPEGLARSAIYISTEDKLNTSRLWQILESHPVYINLPPSDLPSLDHIHCISATDLEVQEHIIEYQLPLAVKRYNAGLVVVDSVAANYRAEHQTRTAGGMAERATALAKLAKSLGRIAMKNNVAVVVTNQVSDRFDDLVASSLQRVMQMSSPAPSSPASRSASRSVIASTSAQGPDDVITVDHQQRFFTGWGDDPGARGEKLKTPALGVAWANLISTRVVLKIERPEASQSFRTVVSGSVWNDQSNRRFLTMVFSPWTEETVSPVQYEIKTEGIVSVDEFDCMELDEMDWSEVTLDLGKGRSNEGQSDQKVSPVTAPAPVPAASVLASIGHVDGIMDVAKLLQEGLWSDDEEFP